MDSSAHGNAVTEAIDGATGDWSMSGDAMRWSPELIGRPPAVQPAALASLGTVAADVVGELRRLTRALSPGPSCDRGPED